MRRFATLVAFVVVSTAGLQAPAVAGGWWTHIGLDGQYLGVGESLSVRVREVWFRSVEEAREARNVDYFAYLVRRFDRRALKRAMTRPEPRRWWDPIGGVTRAGKVTLGRGNSNLLRARVELHVPQVKPGSYALMLCDAGCETPLADFVPASIHVTRDAEVARAARKMHDANARLGLAVARARSNLRATRRALDAIEREPSDGARRAENRTVQSRDSRPRPWTGYAVGFFVGAAGALLLTRGRRRRAAGPYLLGEQIPDAPSDHIISDRGFDGGHRTDDSELVGAGRPGRRDTIDA